MKVWIILLSILAAAVTWWWHVHRNPRVHATFGQKIKIVSKSIVAGIAVYFVLMSIALVYLMVANA